ncbi:MAG: tRNA 4-thiouridine(8) synthase ThiI [Clostridia bacterium]|nr:tRNA 4-thiouridine(8) synthase ThiI [Clostridia bacterium]MBO5314907.1 tRNA 4-thiouridine(8) synthase ThiI [Clostridia bacterium]
MPEVILCKFGEVVLKGANRQNFESALVKELRRRACPYGNFKIYFKQSTVYVEPLDELCDMDGMYEEAKRVFGIVGVNRAAVCEKNMEDIIRVAKEYLPEKLAGKRTFKVDAKRSDKKFPLKSPEISAEIGGVILSFGSRIKVDVHNPEVTVTVEVRDDNAFIRAGQEPGAGGLPIRSAGRGLLLLSGGIDSPVAGCMMAKRGLEIEALHFESFPYTSERAKEKVMTLAEEMCAFCSRIHVHVISLTHIQEEIRDRCEEDYFTILLRIFMMRLAERCAREYKCQALITGESLGQVASQTLAAIAVTDSVVNMPVFRPCIGLDKTEIIKEARHYGTFDTAILPFEDCCTVFTPRHPRTQPKLGDVMRELEKLDVEALLDEAYATLTTETKLVYPEYR